MLLSDFENGSQYKSKITDFHPATFILRMDRAGEEGLSSTFSCLIVLLSSFSILWRVPFHFSPQWLLCHFMNQKAFSSKAILLIKYHSDCQIATSFSSILVSADHSADAVVYIRWRGSSLLPVTGDVWVGGRLWTSIPSCITVQLNNFLSRAISHQDMLISGWSGRNKEQNGECIGMGGANSDSPNEDCKHLR